MRLFLLICLAGFATALPQGYNYAAQQQAQSQLYAPMAASFLKDLQAVMTVQSGNFIDNFSSVEGVEQYTPTAATAISAPSAPAVPQQQARYLAPAVAGANILHAGPVYEAVGLQYAQQPQQPQQQHQLQHPTNNYPPQQEAVISKRFYLHSAPEEDEQEIGQQIINVGQPRKNFNVVFIKAPAKSAQKTSIKITPAISEDKTVIYVLAKKQDSADVDAQVYEVATTTAKPEVYFIKYKTAEEAAHAQQTIQAQYDSLGGSTHVSNEGVAPVSSVIGSLDAVQQGHAAELGQDAQEVEAVSAQQTASGGSGNAYLPPTKVYY